MIMQLRVKSKKKKRFYKKKKKIIPIYFYLYAKNFYYKNIKFYVNIVIYLKNRRCVIHLIDLGIIYNLITLY